ncbi:MAG: cadherin-like beta sandwich domain-containing protein [Lachnospiraceae bacterium]|nr:cadherin-like beta sandwich domain-containing protein [Lachnospiraceae bacterium]
MNKKIKQMLAGILLACMLAVVMPAHLLVSMAASGKITFSDPRAEVGQEVNVNMKVSTADGSLGSADIMLSYDASALEFIEGNSVEGGAGSLRAHGGPDAGDLTSIVFSMKFKVLKAANSQITIASQEVYDNNSQAVSITHLGNSTVSAGGNGATASADGLLTSLSVSPGTLSPAFSPSVDSYSVNVGLDVESIDVQALAGEGSSVTVEGSEGLQMGENTVTIKVTAADGVTVKNYTISVTKSEGGETAAAETEAEVVTGVSLEAAAKAITILAPEEGVTLPEAFTQTTIDIDGHKVTGWIWASETDHQYCVFYAMNAAGEKNFYRYDLTEKTIQRYFSDPTAESGYTKEETENVIQNYNSLLNDYKIRLYVIIALAAVSVVLLALVIVLLATRNSQRDSGGARYPEEMHPDEEGASRRRSMSREERYMLGEEDEEEAPEPAARVRKAPAEPASAEKARVQAPEPKPAAEPEPAPAPKTGTQPRPASAMRAGDQPKPALAPRNTADPAPVPVRQNRPEAKAPSQPERASRQEQTSSRKRSTQESDFIFADQPIELEMAGSQSITREDRAAAASKIQRRSAEQAAATAEINDLDDDFEFIDVDLY